MEKWAIILGGSSGLGLASAQKLARHGYQLCIVHRNARSHMPAIEAEFEAMRKAGVNVLSYNVDATNKEKRNEIIASLQEELNGKVKLLLHSIAKGNLKPMISEEEKSLSSEDFRLTIDAMGISLYDWAKAILDADLFDSDGRIISFTSEGNSKAWESYAAVSAAKATLEAITRNMALEFAPHGIKSNCIQAGFTETFSSKVIPGSEQLKEQSIFRNPFKKLTIPEDVANVVYLLCSDEAAWINGAVIPVDGGEHLR